MNLNFSLLRPLFIGSAVVLGCQDTPPPITSETHATRPVVVTPTAVLVSEPAAPPPAALAPAAPRVKNVLLLTVDTLRADQAWMGYQGLKTPHLEKLVDQSVLFERAYSVANTTMPSLSALMMARYPTELERNDCGLPAFWGPDTLAQVLTGAGVHTAGFHGHPIFASAIAPNKGFSEWKTVRGAIGRMATHGAVTGEDIASLTIDFLRSNPPERRFFAWAHFVDPHDSYVRHTDFPPSASPRRGLYDGEVAYTDAQIGKVLSALDAAGLSDSTAVVLAADHGEGFGEHERYRHGYSLHEEEVRVPLAFRIPGVAPRRIDEPRSLIDMARTLSELLDVTPSERWRGSSLLADLGGSPEPRPILIDAPPLSTMAPQRAVVRGHEKLLLQGNSAARYDLAADPAEQKPERLNASAPALQSAQQLFQAIPSVAARKCYQ